MRVALPDALAGYGLLAGLVVLAVAAAWVIDRFAFAIVRAATRRTASDLDDVLVEALHRPLVAVVAIVVAHVMADLPWTQAHVPPAAIAAFRRFEVALFVLAVAYAIVRVARALLRRPGTRFAIFQQVGLLASRLVAVVVYTVAFLVVLDQYGLSITPILTSLGIAGLAVALALQDTLANFFAGIWIQTGRALRPGHFVRIEDLKLEGTIVDVGWRTTQVRNAAGNTIVVPNARLGQAVVIDHDLPDAAQSLALSVTVPFDVAPARVAKLLAEEAEASRAETQAILPQAPLVRLSAFRDLGQEHSVYLDVRTQADAAPVLGILRRRIVERLQREGIPIAHATALPREAPA